VAGQRVTDDATMNVVEMVLGGTVNKEIVRLINRAGGRAVGISGKDGKLVRARKMTALGGMDPGLVGEVESVSPEILEKLLAADFIPVIAPIASDAEGRTLNINADPFAAKIAAALRAEKLVLLTDVEGVRDAGGKLMPSLTADEVDRLITDRVIDGGMIPKVECGLDALREGVRKVHIVDGRLEHAILLEIFTDQGIGTELVAGR
jgi:acetylglutamate kinase